MLSTIENYLTISRLECFITSHATHSLSTKVQRETVSTDKYEQGWVSARGEKIC